MHLTPLIIRGSYVWQWHLGKFNILSDFFARVENEILDFDLLIKNYKNCDQPLRSKKGQKELRGSKDVSLPVKDVEKTTIDPRPD